MAMIAATAGCSTTSDIFEFTAWNDSDYEETGAGPADRLAALRAEREAERQRRSADAALDGAAATEHRAVDLGLLDLDRLSAGHIAAAQRGALALLSDSAKAFSRGAADPAIDRTLNAIIQEEADRLAAAREAQSSADLAGPIDSPQPPPRAREAMIIRSTVARLEAQSAVEREMEAAAASEATLERLRPPAPPTRQTVTAAEAPLSAEARSELAAAAAAPGMSPVEFALGPQPAPAPAPEAVSPVEYVTSDAPAASGPAAANPPTRRSRAVLAMHRRSAFAAAAAPTIAAGPISEAIPAAAPEPEDDTANLSDSPDRAGRLRLLERLGLSRTQTLQTGSAAAEAAPARSDAPAGDAPALRGAVHKVTASDTLAGVAAAFGVTPAAIRKANDMAAGSVIYEGQQLFIPTRIAPPSAKEPLPQPIPAARRLASPQLSQYRSDRAPWVASPLPGAAVVRTYGAPGGDGLSTGVAFDAGPGALVRAASDGQIAFLRRGRRGKGGVVTLLHSDGFISRYTGLGAIQVRHGQRIKRGQVLGETAANRRTGGVLLFELMKGQTPVDPTPYFKARPL